MFGCIKHSFLIFVQFFFFEMLCYTELYPGFLGRACIGFRMEDLLQDKWVKVSSRDTSLGFKYSPTLLTLDFGVIYQPSVDQFPHTLIGLWPELINEKCLAECLDHVKHSKC